MQRSFLSWGPNDASHMTCVAWTSHAGGLVSLGAQWTVVFGFKMKPHRGFADGSTGTHPHPSRIQGGVESMPVTPIDFELCELCLFAVAEGVYFEGERGFRIVC